MIIYPNTEISWGGKEYTTKVHYGLIMQMERTVNLATVASKCNRGEIVLTHLAEIYGFLLRSGGCDVSGEEVYLAMLGGNEEADLSQKELILATTEALNACFPERPEESEEKPKKKVSRKKKS